MVKPEQRLFVWRISPRWHIKGFLSFLGFTFFPFEYEAWSAGKHGKCFPFGLLYLFYSRA